MKESTELGREGGAVTFGLSLPRVTAERVNTLLGIKAEKRNRSDRYVTILVAGMESLYGDDWAERADRLRAAAGEGRAA